MKLRFAEQAEIEVAESWRWYEERRALVADEFLEELARVLRRIEDSPEQFPREETNRSSYDVRRCRLSRFPFRVIYQLRQVEVVVLAVAHNRRRPGYWRDRTVS